MRSVFVGSGVYPLLLHVGLGALRHQIVSDRRREEDRGGRTYDHADDQREDEAADRLAAVTSVVPEVLIVRDSVELMALFTVSFRLRFG